jgi:tetratricopeptide (TPR) repeat protein
MRILACLTVSLLAALTFLHPSTASAQADPAWQTCIGPTATPDERVSACTAVIDARTKTGPELAGAYCNRGHGLTEKRELDAALADLDEAVRLDPAYACARSNDPADVFSWNNRGQARLRLGDKQGVIADFRKALELRPDLRTAREALAQLGAAP